MSADVIPFPQRPERRRSCLICEHASLGAVTYCTVFREEITFETLAAEDCEAYEEDPDA